MVKLRPGDIAPASDRYAVVDRFDERLNVEVLCDQGDRLPLIAVVGFNPVFYIRAEAVSAS
jgi:hypothetical protein